MAMVQWWVWVDIQCIIQKLVNGSACIHIHHHFSHQCIRIRVCRTTIIVVHQVVTIVADFHVAEVEVLTEVVAIHHMMIDVTMIRMIHTITSVDDVEGKYSNLFMERTFSKLHLVDFRSDSRSSRSSRSYSSRSRSRSYSRNRRNRRSE